MMLFDLFQATLVAILIVSVIAKITSWLLGRAVWPSGENFFSIHIPMWVVIIAEIIVIATYLAPAVILDKWSSLAIVALYASFAVASTTLRGQTCACFGVRGKPIGPIRIGINWLAVVVAAIPTIFPSMMVTTVQRLVAVLIIAIIIVLIAGIELVIQRTQFMQASKTTASVQYLITSPGCAACDALHRLLYDINLSQYDVRILDKSIEEEDLLATKLAPGSATPALVVVPDAERLEKNQIVSGAGPCYDQIKQLVRTTRHG